MGNLELLFTNHFFPDDNQRNRRLIVSARKAHVGRWLQERERLSASQALARISSPTSLKPTRKPHSDRWSGCHCPRPCDCLMWYYATILGHITLRRPVGPADAFGIYPINTNVDVRHSIAAFESGWLYLASQVMLHDANRAEVARSSSRQLLQHCLKDNLHMEALKAMSRMGVGIFSPDRPLATVLIVISQLRQRLDREPSIRTQIFLPILFLATYECFAGHMQACQTHMKALGQLDVPVCEFDHLTWAFCRRLNSLKPISYATRPIFGVAFPMPLLGLNDSTQAGSNMGTAFASHEDVLGTDFLNLIPYTVDCLEAAQVCLKQVSVGEDPGYLATQVIERCWALPCFHMNWEPAAPEAQATIEILLMWLIYLPFGINTAFARFSAERKAYYRKLMHRRTQNIRRLLDISDNAPRLMLWIAATALASTSDDALSMQLARHTVRLMNECGVADLKVHLSSYLWIDGFELISIHLIMSALHQAGAKSLGCPEL